MNIENRVHSPRSHRAPRANPPPAQTITGVFVEPPEGYRPTCHLAWVTHKAGIFEDPQTILAQCWEAKGQPEVWIAVPSVRQT